MLHLLFSVNEPEQLVDYEFAQREICMNDRTSGTCTAAWMAG